MREMLLEEVRRSVKTAYPEVAEDLIDRLTLEPPRDPSHGDFSSNAAFLLKDVVTTTRAGSRSARSPPWRS